MDYRSDSPEGTLPLLYGDAHMLAVDKPAGLLSVPGRGADKQDCAAARVRRAYPDALVVHRLDMATSGLLLMARGPAMQRALSRAFEQRRVGKRYVALAAGRIGAPASADDDGWGCIDLPLAADWPKRPRQVVDAVHGRPSRTRWRILGYDVARDATRVELEPVTGRSHQLRVHLLALGHPILGDVLYAPPAVRERAPRLLLHASMLEVTHPATGERLRCCSPVPF